MSADLRFGVNLTKLQDRSSWVDKCRRAEDLGYDVITIPDHLGMPSPFPACVLAAESTSRLHVGTFVSNTAFYHPVLFARDVVSTQALTGNRLEVGLGAGWKKRDFVEARVPFEAAGKRVAQLVATVAELQHVRELAAASGSAASGSVDAGSVDAGSVDPVGPIMIGGNGDRVLRLAARHADIISFAGTTFDPAGRGMVYLSAEQLDERVAVVDAALAECGRGPVQQNVIVLRTQVVDDRPAALADYSRFLQGTFSPDQVGELPAVLIGSPEEIAAQILARRDRFGIGYFTVQEAALDSFAKVMALLR